MEQTESFLQRYHKHIQTPGFGVRGQEALLNAKILVVGAAELASPVLSYLCSMGVGHIGVVSQERVSLADLPSAPLLYRSQTGKLKTQAVSQQLREINPELKLTVYDELLNADTILQIVGGYDLIIDATNVHQHSLLINDACVICKKPWVYGSIVPPSGNISVFNYKGGATYRCLLEQTHQLSLSGERAQYGLATLAGITGSLMANEVVKLIGEIGDVATNRYITFNSLNNRFETMKISPILRNLTLSSLQAPRGSEVTAQSDGSDKRAISASLLALKIKYKETLQLIDIRESPGNEKQNTWNFLYIPQSELLKDLQQIHQDILVVLISEKGETAEQLAALLNSKHGFDNIYYLDGGIDSWKRETGNETITYESF